jgi:carbamoyl-phosphate synthase large subunit
VPWTRIVGEAPPLALPCSQASAWPGRQRLRLVNTEEEVKSPTGAGGDLWQELLLPEDQEYTTAVPQPYGETHDVLRRRLQGGQTGAAVVADSPVRRCCTE